MFTLVRVVNVEKRANGTHSSRYLLELEVKDLNGQLLRLSRYICARRKPTLRVKRANKSVLCNPVGLEWNPDATVHIIVAGSRHHSCFIHPSHGQTCLLKCSSLC